MLDGIDPELAGVVVFAGFGLGRHVELMARRFRAAGLILVVEPDLSLLKAVFSRIDFTDSFVDRNVRIVDSTDAADIHRRLAESEGLVALGIRVVEHPPSRARLGGVGSAGEHAGVPGRRPQAASRDPPARVLRGAFTGAFEGQGASARTNFGAPRAPGRPGEARGRLAGGD